ncbi:MAG: hypothetical protein CL785_05530 [Chloroflexi bacterium]|nr:hypothetical protein [Chloroflexota bacterium]|tara:strand:- start:13352 stop:15415 length:2064 start_codon:yes stop_codon:yes gene_type:complete
MNKYSASNKRNSSFLQRDIHITNEILIYFFVIFSGVIFRLWQLDFNAMHHDESLHAVYSWYLSSGQGYFHDPMMHGPFQYHMNTLIFFFFGDNDFTARLGYSIFGSVMIGMPLLLRKWIGKEGALIASLLIAFSPSLIYFSRFARNDILMAVWILGLLIFILKHIREPREKYLYLIAAFLSLSFTTKETAYLSAFALCVSLFFLCSTEIKNLLLRKISINQISPPFSVLILITTLSLPLCSAAIAIVLNSPELTLANTNPLKGPIGLPLGNGIPFSWSFSLILMCTSILIGIKWNLRIWIPCALIFLLIFILLHTTFLTNPTGLVTGTWQSLGYWVAQQDVQRGNQPFYYYLILLLTYEYTIFIIGFFAFFYFIRKGDIIDKAILLWAITTTILFIIASEKMPWLIVHITLPWILIVSKFLGVCFKAIPFKAHLVKNYMIIFGLGLITMFILYKTATYNPYPFTIISFIKLWILIMSMAFVTLACYKILTNSNLLFARVALILTIFSLSLILQIRTGYLVTFVHRDIPKEMLIYTQTSQDVRRISAEIENINKQKHPDKNLSIIIDNTDGFAWPWVWYLRNIPNKIFYNYDEIERVTSENNSILLINTRNNPLSNNNIANNFTIKEKYQHRAWFPENYKGTSPMDFVKIITDVNKRKELFDYWVYRNFKTPIGHVDAYLLYSKELEQ